MGLKKRAETALVTRVALLTYQLANLETRALAAIDYVGKANYRERQQTARDYVLGLRESLD